MKRILICLTLFLFSAFVLVGCGVTGNSTIVALSFSKPVFYLDLNCETQLSFKAYPITAKNYKVSYSTSREGGFTLNNGTMKITEAVNFKPVLVTIKSGNYQDSCYVVRKSYPSQIAICHNDLTSLKYNEAQDVTQEITIMSNTSTSFTLMGKFRSYFDEESAQEKNYATSDPAAEHEVSPEIFNFKMESSNPTVVSVSSDPKQLSVKANEGVGSAYVTIYLADSNGSIVNFGGSSGSQDYSNSCTKIKVNVVNPVSSVKLYNANGGEVSLTPNNITAVLIVAAFNCN